MVDDLVRLCATAWTPPLPILGCGADGAVVEKRGLQACHKTGERLLGIRFTSKRSPAQRLEGFAFLVTLLAPLRIDSALYSAENLQKLAETSLKWITRVPATLHEAQAVLAQADPQTMAPLTEGYRYHVVPSSYGGVAQRWVLIYSEPRQPQAQRTVDK